MVASRVHWSAGISVAMKKTDSESQNAAEELSEGGWVADFPNAIFSLSRNQRLDHSC